jgi:hypothetical protein
MARRSNKSAAKILSQTNVSPVDRNDNDKHLALLEMKITLATEGFTTDRFCELVLTEKSTKLKSSTLNQHAGWATNSGMAQKYIHYFGNESSESLLEAYGIVTKNNVPIDTLNPKICPNFNEGNTQDARFCSKCKMIMSFDGYQEALESQKQKEDEVTELKKRQERFELLIQSLIDSGQLKPLT